MSKVKDPVVTKSMLDSAIKGAVDDIAGIIDVFATRVDERLVRVEHDIAELKQSHERLLTTIDGFIRRIDRYESEQVARDLEVQRLKAWIQQIAEETGVKLKGQL